jgi:hypothetical protein
MFGYKENYNIEIWRGGAGNMRAVSGTYEEAMDKAQEEREQAGVTKVIVTKDGRKIATL